ncbi:MAG: hypothetical protein RLP12_05940, partial [Ekhidna sp.]
EDYVDLDILRNVIDKILTEQPRRPDPRMIESGEWKKRWDFHNQMLLQGLAFLIQKRPNIETHRQVKQVLTKPMFHISAGTLVSLENLLPADEYGELIQRKLDRRKIIDQLLEREKHGLEHLERLDANREILEAVIRATKNSTEELLSKKQPYALVSLGTLIQGMSWLEFPLINWDRMSVRQDIDAVDTVFRGAIMAMDIEPYQVAVEAAWVLRNVYHQEHL